MNESQVIELKVESPDKLMMQRIEAKLDIIVNHFNSPVKKKNEDDLALLNEEGYYYKYEIADILGWPVSTWQKSRYKQRLTIEDRNILERNPNRKTELRCKRADLHYYLYLNNKPRFNQLKEGLIELKAYE